MTLDILITLIILGIAVLFFITERLRIDLTALLVLSALALTGLVSPVDALSGFSNPATVTMWAVFIISGGLAKVGIANIIGRQVIRFSGKGEIRLIAMIMLTSGLLSGIMNNIGVAALMLPVVMDIARTTGRPPSKLLIPLAYGTLLGGMITQIGTPPNILISSALAENNLYAFEMFDYTPIGLLVTIAGVVFMALIGRHLLPNRDPITNIKDSSAADLGAMYDLEERMYSLRLPTSSTLDGQTLEESRLGEILGLNVSAIIRAGKPNLAPQPGDKLYAGDQLLVTGKVDQLVEIKDDQLSLQTENELTVEQVMTKEIHFAELILKPEFPHLGKTLKALDFRNHFRVAVISITRNGEAIFGSVDELPLAEGDILLVQGFRMHIEALDSMNGLQTADLHPTRKAWLDKHLMALNIPKESALVGKTLAESHLADAFGLAVLAIERKGSTHLLPSAEYVFQANDRIYVRGEAEDLLALDDLQDLQLSSDDELEATDLESPEVGLVEAMLSPHTTLSGKTLEQLHFREKYGLNVLAIWRGGRPYRSNLRDIRLRLGDALLLHGPRRKLKMLASDADFLVLAEEIQEEPRFNKIPVALGIMGVVLIPVIFGWLPIYISAVVGAALMILSGCLSMDEAYRFIEWKAVFLIAGMLPLGIAMEQTGTARFLAESMIQLVGGFGPLAVMAALFVLTTLSSQVMPNAAAAVLLAPIALNTAADLGISPYALMMTVAVSASASFLSPVAHASNVLVLGPGGYQFRDFLKVGIPLTFVIMGLVLLVLPIFWPL